MSELSSHVDDVAGASWRAMLIPAFILGPPVLAVLVWMAVAYAVDFLGWVATNSEPLRLVGFAHLMVAVVGSALGGLEVKAPLGTRVAIGLACAVYGGSAFYALLLLADFLLFGR